MSHGRTAFGAGRLALLALFVAMVRCDGQGQLTLSAGETYTYEFTSMQLSGPAPVPDFPDVPYGRLDTLMVPGTLEAGDSLLAELFEGSPSDQAIASQIVSGSDIAPPVPGHLLFSIGAWQDLQGAVRLSMITGSVTVYSARVSAVRNESSGLTLYSQAVPLPEPTTAVFSALGAVMMLVLRARGR